MSENAPSLRRLLDELHAERVRSWEPAALQGNIDQRWLLVETVDPSRFVRLGDLFPNFILPEAHGGTVSLETLLRRGPVALIFFRFAGCPACNVALPYYKRRLLPGLTALGASLVAISPQVPEHLVDMPLRHDLGFPVVSDTGNALGRRLGITFTASAAAQAAALKKGVDLGAVTGTGTWELPMPTVLVLDQAGIVRFVDVAPDWMARTEAEPVLDAVRSLAAVEA